MSDLVFDQWVFGRTPGGTRWHAFKRIAGDASHPLGGRAYIVSSLCSARGPWGERLASNEPFDPSSRQNVCTDCSRRWTAQHALQVPGWTKKCTSCAQDKAINQFHVDKRTKDGVSKVCFDCTQAAKAAVAAAEQVALNEAERQRVLAESERTHERSMAALEQFQASALLPTFRCTLGHVLTPARVTRTSEFTRFPDTEFPGEAWSCPCGTAPISGLGVQRPADGRPPFDWSRVFDAVAALEQIANVAPPEPVRI